MSATITEHVPNPFNMVVNAQGQTEPATSWFDVSCDGCGWQSKPTDHKDIAEMWKRIHDGEWPGSERGCPL